MHLKSFILSCTARTCRVKCVCREATYVQSGTEHLKFFILSCTARTCRVKCVCREATYVQSGTVHLKFFSLSCTSRTCCVKCVCREATYVQSGTVHLKSFSLSCTARTCRDRYETLAKVLPHTTPSSFCRVHAVEARRSLFDADSRDAGASAASSGVVSSGVDARERLGLGDRFKLNGPLVTLPQLPAHIDDRQTSWSCVSIRTGVATDELI